MGRNLKLHSKALWVLTFLFVVGCSNASEEAAYSAADGTSKSPKIETVFSVARNPGLNLENIPPPMNCPAIISAVTGMLKNDNQYYLRFFLEENPNFDSVLEDDCKGDVKNLWSDLLRYEVGIENYFPNVGASFHSDIIMRNFPKTELELKRFIDVASKAEGLPKELDRIDRTTLEGGLAYHGSIAKLIFYEEQAYWESVHTPIFNDLLSKYGTVQLRVGSEKLAYCYHPHRLCRGYDRYTRKTTEKPENHIGRKSELDLEYLWAGIGGIGFDLAPLDESSDQND